MKYWPLFWHNQPLNLEMCCSMADILPFKRKKLSQKHKGNTLCREGFHKWVITQDRAFDVKQGRLVTQFRCRRCGKLKTQYL
jgi:hypothetical protein